MNGSRTGFDGRTSTWNKIATALVNGQYTRQNVNTSSTVTKTADGTHTKSETLTGADGKSSTAS